MKRFRMEYEVYFRGEIEVEAEDADAARRLALASPMYDEHYLKTAEAADWKVIGTPVEVEP